MDIGTSNDCRIIYVRSSPNRIDLPLLGLNIS